jgi:6-pyruvoyltetrahydropterin/6-carboxytetrahydropterin synthase
MISEPHETMYTVAVRRGFTAGHYLVGGDWGAENRLHRHEYVAEVRLEGRTLDRHGYLADIDAIAAALDAQVDRYRDATLNEQPGFAGLNPSIEHFARILAEALAADLAHPALRSLAVRLWENADAWAEYRCEW